MSDHTDPTLAARVAVGCTWHESRWLESRILYMHTIVIGSTRTPPPSLVPIDSLLHITIHTAQLHTHSQIQITHGRKVYLTTNQSEATA